jgi:hypothetical protein
MIPRTGLLTLERISRAILVVRGQRVMLDREPAAIYGVTIKRLNEQVKRNAPRFPCAIRALMIATPPRRRGIGFTADLEDSGR